MEFKEIVVNFGCGSPSLTQVNEFIEIAAVWSKLYVGNSKNNILQAGYELLNLSTNLVKLRTFDNLCIRG